MKVLGEHEIDILGVTLTLVELYDEEELKIKFVTKLPLPEEVKEAVGQGEISVDEVIEDLAEGKRCAEFVVSEDGENIESVLRSLLPEGVEAGILRRSTLLKLRREHARQGESVSVPQHEVTGRRMEVLREPELNETMCGIAFPKKHFVVALKVNIAGERKQ